MSEEHLVSHPCISRYSGNPVLTSADVPFSSDLVFNAGVIPWQGGYAMVFRNDYGYIGRASFSGTNLGQLSVRTAFTGRWRNSRFSL